MLRPLTGLLMAELVAVGCGATVFPYTHQRLHGRQRGDSATVVEVTASRVSPTTAGENGNSQSVSTAVDPLSLMRPSLSMATVPSPSTCSVKLSAHSSDGSSFDWTRGQELIHPWSVTVDASTIFPGPPERVTSTSVAVGPAGTSTSGHALTSLILSIPGEHSMTEGQRSAAVRKGTGTGMGICYDMIDGSGKCKTPSTCQREFNFLQARGFGQVRVYDVGCPVGDFVAAAGRNGMTAMVGINSIDNFDTDLQKLIAMVGGAWDPIDTVYICNECVSKGVVSAAHVAGNVTAARRILQDNGFVGHVVTVDSHDVMMNDPTICSTSDYCATNIHAFFDPNTSADLAGKFVSDMYAHVASTNNNKRVVITESGWPWRGQCNGRACPSAMEQVTALKSITSQFASRESDLFLFQGYDAGYKSGGQFDVEPYFGIFDANHFIGD